MSKSLVAVAVLGAFAGQSDAFDTFWHSAASEGAGQQFQFSADAVNVLQFGTFGPDFFGPLYDYVGKTSDKAWEKLAPMLDLRAKRPVTRKAGEVMHFDNLGGAIDHNWKLDYLFRRLLDNTRTALAAWQKDGSLNEGTKKILILVTLGSSLHMVEDFYSHSDWIHHDFVKLGFPQQQSIWHQDYAPSWFQVVDKLGPPAYPGAETWPIEVRTGIYEPPDPKRVPKTPLGIPMDHTEMSHDNSQLYGDHAPQFAFHNAGAHPATSQATAAAHQLYAINTAAMAATEWIRLVEQDPDAKAAIEYAHDWHIKKYNPAMLTDLESGLMAVAMLSCLPHKWDGDHPPKARETQCSFSNTGVSVPSPQNEYWAVYIHYNILEKLTAGFVDANAHYAFDEAWYKAHRPKDAKVTIDLDDFDLQIEAPKSTIKHATKQKVTLTGPDLGTVEIAPAAPTTVDQAAEQAQKEGGTHIEKPPATPPDYVVHYQLGGADPTHRVICQRTIGQHTYAVTGTGTAAQAAALVDACKDLHVLGE